MTAPPMYNVASAVLCRTLAIVWSLPLPGCVSLCASVYMCFVVTCWERADLLALVCVIAILLTFFIILYLYIVILCLQFDHNLRMKSTTYICKHFPHMIDTYIFKDFDII